MILYYNPEMDTIAVLSKKVNGMDLLILSEIDESSNVYRVLTDKWVYIGELNV